MNDIFKKFSPNLKKALIDAEKVAAEFGSKINTEHQLLSLLQNKDTLAFEILSSFEISADRVNLIASLMKTPENSTSTTGQITPEAKKTIQLAVQNALKFHHNNIGSEHLLLALVSAKSFNSYQVIERAGVDPKKIKKQIESIFAGINNSFQNQNEIKPVQEIFDDSFLPPEMPDDQPMMGFGPMAVNQTATAKKDSVLDQFSTNITKQATDGILDPVIGREKEITRIVQTLSRRTKNNPILIGEPGVGKTAIVEGLAQRVITHQVPPKLQGTEILSIDLGSILAGTMYRGQFESRIKKILAEIKRKGNVILFVDEIHMMVGAGSTEGSIDAANLLKPMLARGELRMIGSTTFDEYKKHIEKDPAFERRFQPIAVTETTVLETTQILHGIKSRYEKFHHVKFSDDAISAAAELSARYINDRFLPDKAIDLIDEAGASQNLDYQTNPKLKDAKNKLSSILKKKETLIMSERYEEATLLRSEELRLEKEIKNLVDQKTSSELKIVTEKEIAKLISDWTGVPVANINTSERKNYLQLEKKLRKFIVGQDEAIKELAKALKRSRTGISNPKRPIGSFMFLGPTGVGKTELAKILARDIFNNENALIKLDMSEFMEKHNVARLIGAPAGYIGYEEGGRLTETVRKNPYSVLLFDEIEKAHPEVFNILLQIMEEGALSDAKGRKVDFKNCIIILTSNLGTDILRQGSIGFNRSQSEIEKYNKLKENVLATVEKSFRPEFINRLDQIIVFYPLSKASIRKIVELQLDELKERLSAQKITLKFTSDVIFFIAENAFSAEYGARPIRKYISDTVETLISDALLNEEYKTGSTISLSVENDRINLS